MKSIVHTPWGKANMYLLTQVGANQEQHRWLTDAIRLFSDRERLLLGVVCWFLVVCHRKTL